MTDDTNSTDPVARFLAAIEHADIAEVDCWTPDIRLDATVPGWQFEVAGVDAVRAEYQRWFADPGSFDTVRRWPIPDGEVVEYTLVWEEAGVPHAGHHVHILELTAGRIARDTVMCGGRWPASLLAEMEAARA